MLPGFLPSSPSYKKRSGGGWGGRERPARAGSWAWVESRQQRAVPCQRLLLSPQKPCLRSSRPGPGPVAQAVLAGGERRPPDASKEPPLPRAMALSPCAGFPAPASRLFEFLILARSKIDVPSPAGASHGGIWVPGGLQRSPGAV